MNVKFSYYKVLNKISAWMTIWAESRPPMDWYQLHFQLKFTFSLADYWPVALFFGTKTLQKSTKITSHFFKKEPHRPEIGELDSDWGPVKLVKPFHWGSWFSPGRHLELILEISDHKCRKTGYKFSRVKNWIFHRNFYWEAHISKSATRPLLGLNRDPPWNHLSYILGY